MWQYWAHLKYTLRHKWWVTYYCFKDGLYLQGILHDLSKFSFSEFSGYANFFFDKRGNPITPKTSIGYYDASESGKKEFDKSWNHHQKSNKHHWQYWAMIKDDGSIKCLDIPNKYLQEMVCDWQGAGRTQGNNPTGSYTVVVLYYNTNKDKMFLSENTRNRFETLINTRLSEEMCNAERKGIPL